MLPRGWPLTNTFRGKGKRHYIYFCGIFIREAYISAFMARSVASSGQGVLHKPL